MKKRPDTSQFLRGSLILTCSAVVAKVCGAMFRIPLTALLGGTGMGYFSTAYGLFLPLYAVLVTGISTAVAQTAARYAGRGDLSGARVVCDTARRFFFVTGAVGTAGALFGAGWFVLASAGDPAAYPAVLAIAPAILLCSLTAVGRGYREGLCDMRPTAVSQAVEAAVRLVCGLWLCRMFLHHPPACLAGYPPAAAGACGAVFGVTIGAGAGLLCTAVQKPVRGGGTHPARRTVLRELLGILIPVSLGALVTDLTSLLDLVTVMHLLPAGQDPAFVYGSFMGLAVTVFSLIPSLTGMLARSVLPCAAQCRTRGDLAGAAHHARQVLLLTGLVCIPAGCGLFALPEGALTFLFAGRSAEIAAAQDALRYLTPGLICLCLGTPVFSLLQAFGKPMLPVLLMLPGLAVKLAGNLLLIPRCGITGAALSTSLCYLVILLPSLAVLRRILGVDLRIGRYLLTEGFGGILCAACAWSVYGFLGGMPQRAAFLLAVLAGAGVYAVVVLLDKDFRDVI
jgi:stage V sporulation protein B